MPEHGSSPAGETLNDQFLEDVLRMPDGEKLKTCLQCGTCSASCPTSEAMDYTPRQVIAFFRAGMIEKVLRSNTIWLCASCYSCAARCPAGIKFTDLMYELKRLALQHGIDPPGEGKDVPILTRTFVDIVKQFGRNPETTFMTKYTLRSNPLGGIKQLPLAFKLRQRGRLDLGAKSIRGIEDLRKIMDAVEAEEGSS